MKIAILDMDNVKNPHWGSGQAIATREIGKRLAKRHHVVVYCSKYPGYKDYQENGINYQHIGLGSDYSRVDNLAYLAALPFAVRKIKADVIIENFTAPISTGFTPLFTKLPVVGLSSFFNAEILGKKYKLPFFIVERLGVKFYRYFIALNKNDNEKIKMLNSKIISKIIPNGVDEKYFKYRTKEKGYTLFIGRIDIYQKGIDLLIAAFSDIANSIKEDLYIMGEGTNSDMRKLRRLIAKYKVTKRVKLLGKLTGDRKDRYLADAKYIVFSSRYEGHSLSALESVALGKPLVCFDIPGFEWINSEACIKVKPFDVLEFSNAMLNLSDNDALRKNLSNKAREIAKSFTWDRCAKKYEQLLFELVSNNKKAKQR